MATQTRRAGATEAQGQAPTGGADRSPAQLAPPLLAAGLAAALLYAAFASGAIRIPDESRLQLLIVTIALPALAATLFGALRCDASGRALAGIGMLVAFAGWSALSITWSVAPDETWLEANRAVAYVLVVGLGVVLGSSLPRALERVALGYLTVAVVVALYALGGKLFPWVDIPGLLDLDHANGISRLRAPIEYWNALGLFCVLATPVAVRAAADLQRSARLRAAALGALVVLLTTLALTYSRGGLLVLVVALALLVAIGPDRAALGALIGVGTLGSLPAVLVGVTSGDLTSAKVGGLPLSARTDDGLLMLAALLAGLLVAIVIQHRLTGRSQGIVLSDHGRLLLRRGSIVAAAAAVLLLLGALALSDRGVSGTISHRVDAFTAAKIDRQNDPARILQTNSGNRWVWWQEAVGSWWDRPLVGHGAGSFPLVHRAYRTNILDIRQPHSVPLEFLSETGLIGAALGLGGLALLGWAATTQTLARPPSRERAYGAALIASCAAWGAHVWVDWDWDIPAVTLPLMAFLGVLAARSQGTNPAVGLGVRGARPQSAAPSSGASRPKPPLSVAARGPALGVGAALLCLVAVSALLPALSKALASDALALAARGDEASLREAARKAEVAAQLNPFAVQPRLAGASIARRSGQPEKAGRLLTDAVARQPANALAWFRLAGFQALLTDAPAATRSLATALSLDPESASLAALANLTAYDERRTATVAGTPLPERLEQPRPPSVAKPRPRARPPAAGRGASPRPSSPAPRRPVTPTPAPRVPAPPTARPRPRVPAPPAPAPKPRPPEGQPFRFEG